VEIYIYLFTRNNPADDAVIMAEKTVINREAVISPRNPRQRPEREKAISNRKNG